jgi:hypothetical protein
MSVAILTLLSPRLSFLSLCLFLAIVRARPGVIGGPANVACPGKRRGEEPTTKLFFGVEGCLPIGF